MLFVLAFTFNSIANGSSASDVLCAVNQFSTNFAGLQTQVRVALQNLYRYIALQDRHFSVGHSHR